MKLLLALVAIALLLPSLASKGDNLRSARSRPQLVGSSNDKSTANLLAAGRNSCAVVKEALDDSLHIKAGMTRPEVEKHFTPDGGLQSFSTTGSTTRYVYLKCEFIKINISFKSAVRGKQDLRSPDDVVENVSKPYLEYPMAD
jgi:hypothetical protein